MPTAPKKIFLNHSQFCWVDAADYDWLNQFKWGAILTHSGWRAITEIDGKRAYMSRLILELTNKLQADHKNGNTLDNQRRNLRPATHSQNQQNARKRKDNASGFKGVSFDQHYQTWRVQIRVNGKRYSKGGFKTAELAAATYQEAATRLHGKFSRF